jgi:hypothetical protein
MGATHKYVGINNPACVAEDLSPLLDLAIAIKRVASKAAFELPQRVMELP